MTSKWHFCLKTCLVQIGNLILCGGYLNNHYHLDPIIFLFSKLVEARGTVRAIVNQNLHRAADLEDGNRILGQHRITAVELGPHLLQLAGLGAAIELRQAAAAGIGFVQRGGECGAVLLLLLHVPTSRNPMKYSTLARVLVVRYLSVYRMVPFGS